MRKLLLILSIGAVTALSAAMPASARTAGSEGNEMYFFTRSLLRRYQDLPQDFKTYTLQWLDQDRSLPERYAQNYCAARRAGETDQEATNSELRDQIQLGSEQEWSNSKQKAMRFIVIASHVIARSEYCPKYAADRLD